MAVTMQFRGQGSRYINLAEREGQTLGLGLQYVNYKDAGCLVVRFVAYGEDKPFTHFVVREKSNYIKLDEQGEDVGEPFVGVRLNKVLIPLSHRMWARKTCRCFSTSSDWRKRLPCGWLYK